MAVHGQNIQKNRPELRGKHFGKSIDPKLRSKINQQYNPENPADISEEVKNLAKIDTPNLGLKLSAKKHA